MKVQLEGKKEKKEEKKEILISFKPYVQQS